MELSKKELETILARQINRAVKESEKRIEIHIEVLKENIDHKIDPLTDKVDALQNSLGILQENDETLQSNIEILQENIEILKEDVDEMKPVLDATFEKVGEIAVDIEIIKDAVKNHEMRLQKAEVP